MSFKYLSGIRKELFPCWESMMKRSVWKGKEFKGVPINLDWIDFDFFVKDNWIRYCRSKIKWCNYNRVSPRNGLTGKLKLKKVWFIRYKKELGYTKENTVFTNPSDATKNAKSSHKYMFENRMLGTRDIQNILKKRGIEISMEQIVKRLKNNIPLFDTHDKKFNFYKGKYRSYAEISRMLNISVDLLKKKINKDKFTFKDALKYCEKYRDSGKVRVRSPKELIELKSELNKLKSNIKKYEKL